MTQSELKSRLTQLVRMYFGGATVSWGEVRVVTPTLPHVILTMISDKRSYFPVSWNINGVHANSWPSLVKLQIDLRTKGRPTNVAVGVKATNENTAVCDLRQFLSFLGSPFVENWTLTNDISIVVNQVQDLTNIINESSWEYRAMTELQINFVETATGHLGLSFEGGVPHYSNGMPKYDPITGVPRYENGNPMYDKLGSPLDEHGNPLKSDTLPPLSMPQFDAKGRPIFPEFVPTHSGGGSQELANQFTGWFEQVEKPKQKGVSLE